MCAQNLRWRIGPIETSNSDAILNAENDRCGLAPVNSFYSDSKVAVLHAKTTYEGWDP